MKLKVLTIINIASLCAAVCLFVFSSGLLLNSRKMKRAGCIDCHIKGKPVRGDSDLRPRPLNHPQYNYFLPASTAFGPGGVTAGRHTKIESTANEPDVVMLGAIADKYPPVKFSHRTHADMAQLSGSCWACHHNSPADKPHPACKTCHKVKPDRKNPSTIRLKAAYHRHCIDCHRKWSKGNVCDVCHPKKKSTSSKRPWPRLKQPRRIVYTTKQNGTKVTFFHDNHTKLFAIPCESCHSGETCQECHNRTKKPKTHLLKAGHKICSGCHDTKDKSTCAKCHRGEAMASYSHNSTGFPLNEYHAKVACSGCHHSHKPVVKLDPDCRSCHKGLKFKTFEHVMTGFPLEKPYHSKLACEACHKEGKPMALSSGCTTCHDGPIKGFDHASTGFLLTSWHTNVRCASCHPPGKPMARKSGGCTSCHEENIKGFNHASVTGFELKSYHNRAACISCHPASAAGMRPKGRKCIDCHREMKFKYFEHSVAGFPLKRFHASLACDKCHLLEESFAARGKTCDSCHQGDSFQGLDHEASTGVPLGDLHGSLGCTDCHINGVDSKPVCSSCHDDKSYPTDKMDSTG